MTVVSSGIRILFASPTVPFADITAHRNAGARHDADVPVDRRTLTREGRGQGDR